MKKNIKMMEWAKDLFPICRSLTGKGNIETLNYFKKINKDFRIKSYRSGSKYFDWKIPEEWNINDAYIQDNNGKKFCEFKKNNLHLVGYSKKINKELSFKELKKKIYFDKLYPNSIPYVTSYYKKDWGFCMRYNDFIKLDKRKKYRVYIDSNFSKGRMHYSELLIKGKSKKEILIVSYICHPSMANNELSGILIVGALSKILKASKYSIRLLLIPETIGAIAYIKDNYLNLKSNLIAGINLSCVGDDGPFTLIKSLNENTYIDNIIMRILEKEKNKKILSFLYRGSNERQFGCQNLSLPFVTVCRTRFGDYPEYHTSHDNLKLISEKNLKKSLKFVVKIIDEIQNNKIFIKKKNCEPFLNKYDLTSPISSKFFVNKNKKIILDILAYASKNLDTVEISKKINQNHNLVKKIIENLKRKKIIKEFI